MKRLLSLLLLVCLPAMAQFEVGTGTKATALSPDLAMPAGKIFIDRTTIPPRRSAHSSDRIEVACTGTYNVAPCNTTSTIPLRTTGSGGANSGQFRVNCDLSHVAFDDPIVWPGQTGRTHLHQFFGNTTTRSSTDLANMATSGDSTCAGGTLNRSGYWTPVFVYHCPAADAALYGCTLARNGEVIYADHGNFYYKTAPSDTGTVSSQNSSFGGGPMQWPPAGFRMIGGNPSNTAPLTSSFSFYCQRAGTDVGSYDHLPTTAEATAAGGCDLIKMTAGFGDCWNGVDLDSLSGPLPHQGHLAKRNTATGCTTTVTDSSGATVSGAGYPIMFPGITVNISTLTVDADLDFIRLSSDLPKAEAILLGGNCTALKNWCAGRSVHADWVNGWSAALIVPSVGSAWGMSITDAILQECYMIANNPASPLNGDCHDHLLGSPLGDNRWWSLY